MTRVDDISDAAICLARYGSVRVSFAQAFDSIQLAVETGCIPKEWRKVGPIVGRSVWWHVALIRFRIVLARRLRCTY